MNWDRSGLGMGVILFGGINFLFSIVFCLLADNMPVMERLASFVVINLGYFFFYFLIGKVPVGQLRWLKDKSPGNFYPLQLKAIVVFLRAVMVIALVAFAYFVIASFVQKEYYKIFASMMLWGVFFGADRSRTKIKKSIAD
ncbi:MAG: hypothetical protein WBG71_10055 [Leeuwenhoekiella sp.]